MKTSKHSVTIEPKDFPQDLNNATKQAWIKIDGMEIYAVIGHDGSLGLTRYVSKTKFPKPLKRVKVKTYRY